MLEIENLKAEIANVGTQLKFNGRSLVGEGSSVNSIKSALTNEVIQVGSDINGLYNNGQGSKIGYEVGLSDDGNNLVIGGGALTQSPPTALYKWDGSSWNQLGSNLTGGNTFGESLDISSK